MGTAATYNLEPMVRGDQWRGITQIGPLTINGVAPAAAVASARMQFRRTPGTKDIGHALTSEAEGGITITDAAAWTFTIAPRDLPLPAGDWSYDFETTDEAGRVRTYLTGILSIRQDVTR